MATLSFCDLEDALDALHSAVTEAAIKFVVDQVDQQFNARSLDVTPEQWAHLASAVLLRRIG